MNKKEIVGLALIFIGIIIQFTLSNDVLSFISGILIGGGISFLFAGQIKR